MKALESGNVGNAKEELNDGISLLSNRQKVVKLADKSEFGWATSTYVMIWPTMKRTPQKLKRPRKEPQPDLKLFKRKRRNLAPNFPFPRLRRIALPYLVVRPVLFLLLVVIFVPKVDTPGTFSEAPICVFDAEREVTGPVLAPTKINSSRQDQNHDFSVFDQREFDHSELGIEDPSCMQGKLRAARKFPVLA